MKSYQDNLQAVFIRQQPLGLLLVSDLGGQTLGRAAEAAACAALLGLGHEEVVALDARLVGDEVLELSDRVADNLEERIKKMI